LLEATTVAEKQKLEVELYKLHERINQLFFGMLLMDAQQQQVTLMKKDIQVGLTKVEASIANGVALKSNADILRAELLRADQRTIELKANRQGFAAMLSLLISQLVDENTQLQTPIAQVLSSEISRPELSLFDLQKKSFEIQKNMTSAKRNPRLSLFLQGGYGNPALNALSNKFDLYYLGGLRFNWNLSGFYTEDNDRQLLAISQNAVDIQREVFMFNTRVAMQQQNSEVEKYRSLIDSDNQIIALREEIKTSASAQLEFGTLTSNDYLTYINAEDAARQNLSLHQIQLLMALYSYKTTTGN
jgi:outer membrane protein TolC